MLAGLEIIRSQVYCECFTCRQLLQQDLSSYVVITVFENENINNGNGL